MSKVKERHLKAARKKLVTFKETPIRPATDFSRNFAGQRELAELFKVMKAKNFQQECSAQQGYHSESKER